MLTIKTFGQSQWERVEDTFHGSCWVQKSHQRVCQRRISMLQGIRAASACITESRASTDKAAKRKVVVNISQSRVDSRDSRVNVVWPCAGF